GGGERRVPARLRRCARRRRQPIGLRPAAGRLVLEVVSHVLAVLHVLEVFALLVLAVVLLVREFLVAHLFWGFGAKVGHLREALTATEPVALDLAVQGRAPDLQAPCRLRDVPAGIVERLQDGATLPLPEATPAGRGLLHVGGRHSKPPTPSQAESR